jgi:hypothetical protein
MSGLDRVREAIKRDRGNANAPDKPVVLCDKRQDDAVDRDWFFEYPKDDPGETNADDSC